MDADGYPLSPIYLDSNGVTIKCYDWANVGDSGEINGITYTVVDNTSLQQMIDNQEDVSKFCTIKVTDMSGMFSSSQFNQPKGNWDVISATNME